MKHCTRASAQAARVNDEKGDTPCAGFAGSDHGCWLLAAGCWWFVSTQDKQNKNQLVLYGNVDIREIDLAFNNSEHIDQLLVQEGDRVHKGQLLATLHSERIEAEVAAAKARMAAKKAVLTRLEAGSRPEEVRQARANVAAAKARWVDARATFDRIQNLQKNRLSPNKPWMTRKPV